MRRVAFATVLLGTVLVPVAVARAAEVCIVDATRNAILGALVTTAAGHCTTPASGCCDLEAESASAIAVTIEGQAVGLRVVEVASSRIELEVLLGDDLPLTTYDEVVVRAASRHAERVVEAPAQVFVVGAEDLARRGGHGQVPRLLSVAPGVELAQAGLWDYNLNVRGFGGSTNRRVLMLIDGRDPSQAVFAGAQEWAGLALDELDSAELVYGPSAALYGAGAFNAVLDLRTKRVRDTVARRVELGVGELDTLTAATGFSLVGTSAGDFRLHGSYQRSDDFVRSRTAGGEYPGLPSEIVEPTEDPVRIGDLGARWDRELGPGLLTLEGAWAVVENSTVVTGLGRLERERVDKPWARLAFETPRFAVLASHTGRASEAELSLSSNSAIVLDEQRTAFEIQGNQPFWSDRGLLVAGASWTRLAVDSADPSGRQTLFPEAVSSRHQAAFAQAQVDLGSRLRAVGSLRFDSSDVHDDRLSPRLALVFAVNDLSSVRLSWGQGFLSPTLSEKYLRLAVAPPIDLGPLEDALAPLLGGVPLGLDAVPLLAVGNPSLDTEDNQTLELGWTAVLGDGVALQASAWRSELSDFTSNLLPVVGTSLGTLGSYQPWQAPSALDLATAEIVEGAVASALGGLLLAQDAAGNAFVPLLSFASFGRVDTEGAELGLQWATGPWRLDAGYSYFDAEVRAAAAEIPLSPNRARNQAAAGLGWLGERLAASIDLRWNEGFDYRSGVFVGPVDDALLLDATAGWQLSRTARLELAVSNLFDHQHAENFGGDLLGRRAVLRLDLRW